jgi:NAD-reducing hydrogenase large subunit
MIEMLHAAETIKDLLHDPDILGTDLMAGGERMAEGVGMIEAPRGTLIHHYAVDENDLVTMCNLIVSTTHNNQAMNEAIRHVARRYLYGPKSPRACSTTSRWRSGPTIRASPARPTHWARCR